MSLLVYTWAASLAGAALFFLAGVLWARRRAQASVRLDPRVEGELAQAQEHARRLAAEAERLAGEWRASMADGEELAALLRAASAERDRLVPELRAATSERDRLSAELRAARAAADRPSAEARAARAETERAAADARTARAEVDRLAAELGAARGQLEPLTKKARLEEDRAIVRERALAAVTADRQKLSADLEQTKSKVAALEAQLADAAARVADSERRAAVSPDAASEALRHELVLAEERLRAREAQLERLREDIAALRLVEKELEQVRREEVALTDEVRSLRSAAFASRPVRFPHATPVPAGGSRGNALQAIVDREAQVSRVQSAVIADELGLVVVSNGEYGDALAAFGAYLKDVGAKTREVLPLNEVCQVTVRDDHNVTLTVRPLEAADPNLALVTLAVGQDEEKR